MKIKNLWFPVVILVIIGVVIFSLVRKGDVFEIKLTDKGFEPSNLTIKRGDTVVFVNGSSLAFWPASDLHPTHGIYPEFDPLYEIKPGEKWSFKFTKQGSWRFHDHLNPIWRGVIEVK